MARENIRTRHIVPNTNPEIMTGFWISEDDGEKSQFVLYPIIAYIIFTEDKNEDDPSVLACLSGLESVISPICTDGVSVLDSDFRLCDRKTGIVYDAMGAIDDAAMSSIASKTCNLTNKI